MSKHTHICHTQCTKHGRMLYPGDKITLKDGEGARWFTPRPEKPDTAEASKKTEPEATEDNPAGESKTEVTDDSDPLVELTDKLNKMTKDELEAFARETCQQEVDKRKNNKDIINQILEWSEKPGSKIFNLQ